MYYAIFTVLLATLCNAEYIIIEGEGFNDYVSGTHFQVLPYDEIIDYDNGVPIPPGGAGSIAAYLLDLTESTETPSFNLKTSSNVYLQFWFYCDHSASELEIRMSYPWQAADGNAYLCGPKATDYVPGEWNFGTFTRSCYSSCSHIDIWLYGVSKGLSNIVGIQSLEIATDDSTFPPTETTTTTTPTTPTTTTPTPTTPTTTTPTTTTPTTTTPTTTTPTTTTPTTTAPWGLTCYSCIGCNHVDEKTQTFQDDNFRMCTTTFYGETRNAVVRSGSYELFQDGECVMTDGMFDCFCSGSLCNDQNVTEPFFYV